MFESEEDLSNAESRSVILERESKLPVSETAREVVPLSRASALAEMNGLALTKF